MRIALVCVLAVALSGCAAQLVVAEVDFRPQPADFMNVVVDPLLTGARDLNSFGDVDCRFETNLSVPSPAAQHIDLDINGAIGSPGSNAHLYSFNGEGLPCTPSLPGVRGNLIVTIDLSTDRPLVIGQPVPILAATIVMDDGSVFKADQLYARLTISAVNQVEGTATGTFELVATNSTDPNDTRYLIMRGGLFNADE